MQRQYRKLIAAIALVLFGVKGHAEATEVSNTAHLKSAFARLQRRVKADRELEGELPALSKNQIEALIRQELSNEEYQALKNVILDLASQGIPLEFVKPGNMQLASQEVFGQ